MICRNRDSGARRMRAKPIAKGLFAAALCAALLTACAESGAPQPLIETVPGLPPNTETLTKQSVLVEIDGAWYDYTYTGHAAAVDGDAVAVGVSEKGAPALRTGDSAAFLAIGEKLYQFYSPAEDGVTLGEVFAIFGVTGGSGLTLSGERVDEQGELAEVSVELESGLFDELSALEFVQSEWYGSDEGALMTQRTLTADGSSIPLELNFYPSSGLWLCDYLLTPGESLRAELIEAGEVDLADDGRYAEYAGRYAEYAERYGKWREEAAEAYRALKREFAAHPEYEDGGFYGGAYTDTDSLVVYLTENSAENRAKVEAVTGFEDIEFRECRYSASELHDFRLWLDALMRDGRLPHVTEVVVYVDPRDGGRACVVVDELSDESLDDLRRYDPDLSRTKIVWYSESDLVRR